MILASISAAVVVTIEEPTHPRMCDKSTAKQILSDGAFRPWAYGLHHPVATPTSIAQLLISAKTISQWIWKEGGLCYLQPSFSYLR